MLISFVKNKEPDSIPVISPDGGVWYCAGDIAPEIPAFDVLHILTCENENPGFFTKRINEKVKDLSPFDMSSATALLPFQPRSYRDFMLYEAHYINAAKGLVKKYLPKLALVVSFYEKISGKTFPKLKPHKIWYKYPVFYLGNHLNFVTHGDDINIPEYTKELDYELELGFVICAPLKNATPEEAEKAIGGFVVFNDYSARDLQLDEMQCGFGPMKTKNFNNAISNTVVPAHEILPYIDELNVRIYINDEKIAESTTAGMHHTIGKAIAYASWEEQLYPGEFFGSGTIPLCTGIENGRFLTRGDTIRLEVEKIGVLENRIV